jgi:ribosomal-protein-alanine N-acetyltransferase
VPWATSISVIGHRIRSRTATRIRDNHVVPAIPTIETERLRLRDWRAEDREPFAALNADPDVTRFLSRPLTRDESDAMVDRIVARWQERGYGLWAVERRADGAFLGFTGLSWQDFPAPFTPAIEIGWRLARFAWGNGYATEAARTSLEFGFDTLGLDEIVSFTTVANTPSRRVMERIGMVRDPAGDFEYAGVPEGHPIRLHVLYRVTRGDWLARAR